MKPPSPKIIAARITAVPKSLFDAMPKVYVTTENGGAEVYLFSFYPDEISFQAAEFVGLTIEEAHALQHKKDVAYLQS